MLKLDDRVQGLLVDLDGTVYLGDRLLPGARPFLERVREAGRRVLFLSNNSSRSCAAYRDKLERLGLAVTLDEIFTSTVSAASYLGRVHPGAAVYPLATPECEAELSARGVRLVEDNPAVVLLAFDKTLTYEKIAKAYRFLVGGAAYVATHPDVLCPTEDGFVPDAGSFMALFERATGRLPVVVGKPSAEMVGEALSALGLEADQVAMVGDRLYTDVRMAREGGLLSLLVLSGEATRDDLVGSPWQPDHVVEGVGEIGFTPPL